MIVGTASATARNGNAKRSVCKYSCAVESHLPVCAYGSVSTCCELQISSLEIALCVSCLSSSRLVSRTIHLSAPFSFERLDREASVYCAVCGVRAHGRDHCRHHHRHPARRQLLHCMQHVGHLASFTGIISHSHVIITITSALLHLRNMALLCNHSPPLLPHNLTFCTLRISSSTYISMYYIGHLYTSNRGMLRRYLLLRCPCRMAKGRPF